MGAFEEEARRLLWLVDGVAFTFLVGFRHDAPSLKLPRSAPAFASRQTYAPSSGHHQE
jgi:hypothetical protein